MKFNPIKKFKDVVPKELIDFHHFGMFNILILFVEQVYLISFILLTHELIRVQRVA